VDSEFSRESASQGADFTREKVNMTPHTYHAVGSNAMGCSSRADAVMDFRPTHRKQTDTQTLTGHASYDICRNRLHLCGLKCYKNSLSYNSGDKQNKQCLLFNTVLTAFRLYHVIVID